MLKKNDNMEHERKIKMNKMVKEREQIKDLKISDEKWKRKIRR